jgi:hypothetical protein
MSETERPWELVHLDGYAVRHRVGLNNCYADLEVYEAYQTDGEPTEYMDNNTCRPFKRIEDCAPVLTGSIKWDGCSNLSFNDNVCLHLCGSEGATRFVKVLHHIYAVIGPKIPSWDEA